MRFEAERFNETFFDRLDVMTAAMNASDFDVAIIGAGAYGVHLGANAKALGKVGWVLGGNVGPLFGIKGKRFDSRKVYTDLFYNDEGWVRMDVPSNANLMERAYGLPSLKQSLKHSLGGTSKAWTPSTSVTSAGASGTSANFRPTDSLVSMSSVESSLSLPWGSVSHPRND